LRNFSRSKKKKIFYNECGCEFDGQLPVHLQADGKQENKNFLENQMEKNLSSFESRVLTLYLQGRSYFEIANMLDKPEKSIDNALQRVKKKLEKFVLKKKLDGIESV